LKEGAQLRVHDPQAMEKAKAVLKDVTYVENMNDVAAGCDALVIATEWPDFKKLDLERARHELRIRFFSMAGISLTRRRWRNSGSSTRASGGPKRSCDRI
jgi:UDP-N-acetyl-D-mannosaminuronate dehydrogenase